MPPIEIGPAWPVGAARTNAAKPSTAVASAAAPTAASAPSSASASASASAPAAAVQTSQALDPGKPPIDENRVSVIRNAIQKGTYPLLPTKVADAMIAAGLMLSTK
ncbi:MAG: flagellar biosynthesis anti-sigma factor FlgM [Novosphingobium sp.]|nr:flagellar biosynthesis anti-sigma factor FlgM [Novosphingobium sp.]